ncbi:MAG: DNA repair protein RecN [Saprospiraceae bacterium]
MLTHLHIRNYAIIAQLDLNFPSGMTVITGETGAGKSIVLGALGLIMGNRADTKTLMNQEEKCVVEANFDVRSYALQNVFEALDLDYTDELLIRREINPNGKSRSFVNDTPVTLDVLQTLSDELIDIHQQFDTLNLQKPQFQLQVIDALADNKEQILQYQRIFKEYKQLQNEQNILIEKEKSATSEMEFLQFQWDEIAQSNISKGEVSQLENDLLRLNAGEEIKKATSLIAHGLDESEQATIETLQSYLNLLSPVRAADPEIEEVYTRLLSIKEELKDINHQIMRISESTEYDQEAIYTASQRLNLLNKLLFKHNVTSDKELLEKQRQIEEKLSGFTSVKQRIIDIESQILKIEKELRSKAKSIGKRRCDVLQKFEIDVKLLLKDLAMPHANIKVDIVESDELTIIGNQTLRFLFSANKGNPLLPIKDVASGGEISRLTLVIKSLVANAMTLPTLIFDEIDIGVSGEVALKMGKILYGLADRHQLITITHSPQIAAKGSNHIFVYKQDVGPRMVTALRTLSTDERIIEVAKMLSGDPPSSSAILNAKELLQA